MVLLYMVTWIPSIYPLYVSIYTSTMEHMGTDIKWIITWIIKWIINGWILWPSTPMINVSGCNWMIIGIWIGEWPHYNWDLSWFITPGIANPMAHLSRDGRRGWGWGMLFVWYNIHIIYIYIYIYDIHTYIYIYMIYIHIYIYIYINELSPWQPWPSSRRSKNSRPREDNVCCRSPRWGADTGEE